MPPRRLPPSYVFDGSTWSNGYQAAWHFQEMTGVLTTDSTSNNRHLTAEGGATTGTGQVGNGIVLDGVMISLRLLVLRA